MAYLLGSAPIYIFQILKWLNNNWNKKSVEVEKYQYIVFKTYFYFLGIIFFCSYASYFLDHSLIRKLEMLKLQSPITFVALTKIAVGKNKSTILPTYLDSGIRKIIQ